MTTTNPTQHDLKWVRDFNDQHPVGTPVRYWKGFREGDGKVSRTRTKAQMLSGHTPAVWVEGEGACIALTHIQPITEEELTTARAEARPTPANTEPTWLPDALQELRTARAQVADLADKLHKAQQEIASHTKAGTAWANENDKLKRQLAEQKPVVMAAEDWVELRRTCGETPNADALLRQVVGRLQNAREAEVAR